MKQEELNKIIANHIKWLKGDGGKRANLAAADLYGADLEGVDLRRANLRSANLRRASLRRACLYGADLEGADLEGANLEGADLEKSNLREADLEGADLCMADLEKSNLREADLEGANLCMADLKGVELPIGVYQIVGAGSCNRYTTYDVINDQIVCGCWDDKKGNHLDSFTLRVESIYSPNGERPNSVYYAEYMAAITFFTAMKELNKRV